MPILPHYDVKLGIQLDGDIHYINRPVRADSEQEALEKIIRVMMKKIHLYRGESGWYRDDEQDVMYKAISAKVIPERFITELRGIFKGEE